ncbi:MAG: DUF547 domain-containing protein [Candidatus Lambdaproteobacteria bacterium]|nr:DUF547 domain-containing protein [Candidatus Lambdaproteobacteria bacterium]
MRQAPRIAGAQPRRPVHRVPARWLGRAPVVLAWAVLWGWAGAAVAAPRAELWPRWQTHDPASSIHVDHGTWDSLLQHYLVTGDASGVNLFRYAAVSHGDRGRLSGYLAALQAHRPSALTRPAQLAYWINLYNALTVHVVLQHPGAASIREIDISPGWFSIGPWDAKLATVEGERLSLNDIEHRILRPIWRDPRIHYAVNCASLGCPNLAPVAYTPENTERLLEQGARDYVNHARGAAFQGERLRVSSIYDWFQADFGGDEAGVIQHLLRYTEPPLAARLQGYAGRLSYGYDWKLNAADAP